MTQRAVPWRPVNEPKWDASSPAPGGEEPATSHQPIANGNGRHGGKVVAPGSYTGEQIQILEGVQHIRQRPGMYIGTTSTSGLLHLVYEAVDNVVDEFNAGYGGQMWISIERDGRVTVRDEARGIPIDPKEWGGRVLPTATWIFIKPFTGGKFEQGAYKQAGGLHGVGLTVINALSAELEVDIWRDGQHFRQRFHEGEALAYDLERCDPALHGTQIRWLPDPSIFDEDADYDVETLLSRLEATSCLNGGLRIEVSYWDEETKEQFRRFFIRAMASRTTSESWPHLAPIRSSASRSRSRRRRTTSRSRWCFIPTTATRPRSSPSPTGCERLMAGPTRPVSRPP